MAMTTRVLAGLLLAAATAAQAQPTFDGFLCCNLRSDGRWISDSNYLESGKFVIPAGTPVKVTGYGRYRVLVEIDGQRQALGNDYSRDIAMPDFARRYVVSENPAEKIAAFPEGVRAAIRSARVARGMTREQVLMAVGYPISSETPHLDARVWRFWLWTTQPFTVHFGEDGRVAAVQADPDTRARVVME